MCKKILVILTQNQLKVEKNEKYFYKHSKFPERICETCS